tara:strand:+ start:80 stop:295 length:216 start_codon:yes stop_codon:yes gene_type:complete
MTDVGMFDEIKKDKKIKTLKKRIKELEGINEQHQKLNSELQQENKRLRNDLERVTEESGNFEMMLRNKDAT